jgi:superfamily I DNA/RNA helicase
LKLVAVAGSGKTTTLRFMAEAEPKKKVLYLAFNRAIKEEGERVFPENAVVRTLHGFAHSQVVNRDYQKKLDKGKDNLPPRAIADALELSQEKYLLAYVIRDTLNAFLTSAADTPTPAHLPASYRLLREQKKGWDLEAEYVLKSVRLLWRLMQDPHDPFPLTHDGYVKMWSQGNPVIRGYDAVLVDEAQDLSPVFLNVLEAHRGKLQRVYVGDPRQQIYAWRGAVNAMARLDAPEAWLTWSFRFGLELAEAVRAYFDYLGDPLPVKGKAPWSTQISMEAPEEPFTVLARTNAGVVEAVAQLALGRSDKKVHVVGGVEELARLLLDADDLKHRRPRSSPHPELSMVWTWEELEMLAQELHHPTAKTLLRLAQRYDLAKLASALLEVHVDEEGAATYILSTAHKAKGREWDRVFLWDDYLEVWEPKVRQTYQEKGDEEELREAENLLYVAMTRARKYLRVMPSLLKVLRRELPSLRETQAPEGGEGRERVIQVRVVQEEPVTLEPQGRGILGLAAFLAKIASDPRIPEEIRLEAASWLK